VESLSAQVCSYHVVERPQLVDAMRRLDGYELAATTNAPRLGADVFLDLARRAIESGRNDVLLIRQRDWFSAFLEVTGLSAEQAPPGARLAAEHEQDMLIEYRRSQVLREVNDGLGPVLALAVRASWPETSDGATRYTFEDTLSVPKMRVTSERVVEYRLLQYEGMIIYDRMEGLSGRPLGGFLKILLAILGDARVVQTRHAFAADEYQVMRATAKKGPFSRTAVVTIEPSGRGLENTPSGRPDLDELADALDTDLDVHYYKHPCT
jgi:hypothetical protein